MNTGITTKSATLKYLGIDRADYFPGYHSHADMMAIGIGDTPYAAAQDALEMLWQDHGTQCIDDWLETGSLLNGQADTFSKDEPKEITDDWDSLQDDEYPCCMLQCYAVVEIETESK